MDKVQVYGKEYLTRRTLSGEYAIYGEPSDENGQTTLNIDKLEAVISYTAERVPNLFKVKLMKMLWYVDVFSYLKTDHAMTGLVYRHEDLGALPVGHYSLMNLERLNVVEESSVNYDSMLHIYPTKDMDYSVLSDEDKSVIDKVIRKFKRYTAGEIVEYMHEEKAYTETKKGEVIRFSLGANIRRF